MHTFSDDIKIIDQCFHEIVNRFIIIYINQTKIKLTFNVCSLLKLALPVNVLKCITGCDSKYIIIRHLIKIKSSNSAQNYPSLNKLKSLQSRYDKCSII